MSRQARAVDPSRRANRRFVNKRGLQARNGEQISDLRTGSPLAEQVFEGNLRPGLCLATRALLYRASGLRIKVEESEFADSGMSALAE